MTSRPSPLNVLKTGLALGTRAIPAAFLLFLVPALFSLLFGLTTIDPSLPIVNAGLATVVLILQSLLTIWALIALVVLLVERADGHPSGLGQVGKGAFRLWAAATVALTVVALAVLLGFMALILPGIYLAIALGLTLVVVAAERTGPIAACRRSFHLVRGRWWYCLSVFVLSWLVALVAVLLCSIPLGLLYFAAAPAEPSVAASSSPSLTLQALTLFGETIVNAVGSALMAGCQVMLYRALRANEAQSEAPLSTGSSNDVATVRAD